MSRTLPLRLRARLREQQNAKAAELEKRYHRYEYASYGITAPQLKEILRGFRTEASEVPMAELREITLQLAKEHIEEETQAAIWMLGRHAKKVTPSDLTWLDHFARELCSWSQVDGFASAVMQPMILKFPDEVITLLRRWNKAKSVWLRRLSVVVFTRKTTSTPQFTTVALELCEALVNAEEDLVRKGVGWALKDLMRGDKPGVLPYVKQLRARGVSSTITLYAIRDLTESERKSVLRIGKS